MSKPAANLPPKGDTIAKFAKSDIIERGRKLMRTMVVAEVTRSVGRN